MTAVMLVNLALDPILIFGAGMEERGAGLATTIAYGVGIVILMVKLHAMLGIALSLASVRGRHLASIGRVGGLQFLSMLSTPATFMAMNYIVGSIGETAMMAWSLVNRMDFFFAVPGPAIAGGVMVWVAQNFGQNNLERVRRSFVTATAASAGLVLAMALIYALFAPNVFGLLTDVLPAVDLASSQVRLLAIVSGQNTVGVCVNCFFVTTGRALPPLIMATSLSALVIGTAVVLVWGFDYGIVGVWMAVLAGGLAYIAVNLLWAHKRLTEIEVEDRTHQGEGACAF